MRKRSTQDDLRSGRRRTQSGEKSVGGVQREGSVASIQSAASESSCLTSMAI